METYKQWKERLFHLAKTKGVTFEPWDEKDDSLVTQWNSNLTIEDVLLSIEAGQRCFKNAEAVDAATKCGCFYCLRIFNPQKTHITQWADGPIVGGYTANCPYCRIDSVLPETPDFPIDRELLKKLQKIRFSRANPY